MAEGRICRERAKAIVDVVGGLPPVATVEQQVEVEALLLEHAGRLNARDMRRLHKVLDHHIDPAGVEPREELVKAERAAHLQANGDGTMSVRWVDTEENIALLQVALEPLSAPQPGPATASRIRGSRRSAARTPWSTCARARYGTASCPPPAAPARTSSSR